MRELDDDTLAIILPPGTTDEAAEVLHEFVTLLLQVTGDGGRKRAAGLKPHWKYDDSHEAAIFSHLSKRFHGELRDVDSGCHPYAHLAWRALAIAWRETNLLRAVAHVRKAPPAVSAEQDAVADVLDAIVRAGDHNEPRCNACGGQYGRACCS